MAQRIPQFSSASTLSDRHMSLSNCDNPVRIIHVDNAGACFEIIKDTRLQIDLGVHPITPVVSAIDNTLKPLNSVARNLGK
jgi:hypothetical protein